MASRSREQRIKDPVTIQDYRLLAKALKLKIFKQSKHIEELEQEKKKFLNQINQLKTKKPEIQPIQPIKSAQHQINKHSPKSFETRHIHDSRIVKQAALKRQTREPRQQRQITTSIKTDTILGKKQVMKYFKESVDYFGISLEGIFRVIDRQLTGQIDSDIFRSQLSKINLSLTPKEVSCLIYIFDENCTGTITKQEFIDGLQAYQVSEQSSHAQYMSICLNKLANLMHHSNINFKKFFDEMQGKSKIPVDLDVFTEHVKSVFYNKIMEKQIVAAFNQLDLQKNSIIDRQNFLYGVQSSLNKQHNQYSKQNHQQDSNTQSNKKPIRQNMQSNLSKQNTTGVKNPFDQDVANQLFKQHRQSVIHVKVPVSQIKIEDLIQRYMQQYNLDINKIYEQLTLLPLQKRLTLYSFKKSINQSARMKNSCEVNPESISSLFKLIDCNQKGSLGISQLIYFYLKNGKDLSLVFRLIGKYFRNNQLNAQKFFFLFGISPDSDIIQNRFIEIFSKTFSSSQQNIDLWSKLWNYFDKGKGVQSVAYIIKEMEKYEVTE